MCQVEAGNITSTRLFLCVLCCAVVFVQLLLGQDGADMAVEVLPAQLLSRVNAAWAAWCKQHGIREPRVSVTAAVL